MWLVIRWDGQLPGSSLLSASFLNFTSDFEKSSRVRRLQTFDGTVEGVEKARIEYFQRMLFFSLQLVASY
jgi:hypothetical protein